LGVWPGKRFASTAESSAVRKLARLVELGNGDF